MTLRNKYGLSYRLLSLQDSLYYFYMVDVPLLSLLQMTGILGVKYSQAYDFVHLNHILVKGLILLQMTVESLMSHSFGPSLQKKVHVPTKADASQRPFRSGFVKK